MRRLLLVLTFLLTFSTSGEAQIRVEDTGDGAALCADGISAPLVDSSTLCATFTALSDQQLNELSDIRARVNQLSSEMDPMVAYMAGDILMALVLSAPKIDLRSWNVMPVGFDRAIIHGSLFMARSGAPGSTRTYTFVIAPESAAPQ